MVGTFPKGFKIQVSITDNCIEEVALFVHKRLGQGTATTETATATTTGVTEAIHVFVSRKNDGIALERLFAVQYPNNCRFVSADNSKDEINQVAAEWGRSVFSILISTSIALVGNENPKCRHLACAGYLFDVMSMVQFFGRLRPYMRSPTGQVFLCVPNKLPARRQVDDESRWTTLLNEQLMGVEDHSQFVASMTSKGLQDWLIDAANGTSGCSLKKLSGIMGKKRHDNCGVCKSCRSSPLVVVQVEAQNRLATITSNGTACERVLNRLKERCLACGKENCSGMTFGKRTDPKGQPISGCLDTHQCWTCGGVGNHKRSDCFNRFFLKGKACYECWVWKTAPGAVTHDFGCCPVKARLRRLLSHDYQKTVVDKKATSFRSYFESIYTSEDSFCRFMVDAESKYMLRR